MYFLEVSVIVNTDQEKDIFTFSNESLILLQSILWQNRQIWQDDPCVTFAIWKDGKCIDAKEWYDV